MRFYYKNGNHILNLKTPDFDGVNGYEKITEEEFNRIKAKKLEEFEKHRESLRNHEQ